MCPFMLLLTYLGLLKPSLVHSQEKFHHEYLVFGLAASQKCLTAQ